MSWRRRSTTIRRETRGSSLIELMISCAIFMAISLVLLALLKQNQRADEKVYNHTDTTQMLMLVFEKIRSEVRHGRVIGTTNNQSTLQYWLPRVVNGVPQLTATGLPDWLPGAPTNPDVATLSCSNESLVRNFQGISQKLAPMGKSGQITFDYRAMDHTLLIGATVGNADPTDAVRNNVQTLRYCIFIPNQ